MVEWLRRRLGIRAIVVGVTVVAMAAFWGAGYAIVEQANRHLLDEARMILLSQARLVAMTHSLWVSETANLFASLQFSIEREGVRRGKCGTLLADQFHHLGGVNALLMVDPDGTIWCSSQPADPAIDLSDRLYIRRAIETRALSAGGYIMGRVSGEWFLPLAYPVLNKNGAVRYVLVSGRPLEWINKAIAPSIPEAADVVLYDRGEGIPLRSIEGQAVTPVHFPPGLTQAIADGADGTMIHMGADGSSRIYAHASLAPTLPDLAVVVSVPESRVTDVVAHFRFEARIFLAYFLLLSGIVIALLLSRLVIMPLRVLSRRMTSLGQGEFLPGQSRPFPAPVEIDRFYDAFETMVDDIGRRERRATRADEARLQSEMTLAAIIDASPLGIVVTDKAGRVSLVNNAARHLLGKSDDEAPDISLFAPIASRLVAGERVIGEEIVLRRPDTPSLEIACSAAGLFRSDGTSWGAVYVFEDVTGRRAAAQEHMQAQKMEALGQLTGGLAHDFNNILTIIIGNLELLGEVVEADGNPARFAARALDAARRGAELNRRLLAFARHRMVAPEVVEASSLVSGMHEMLRRTLPEDIALDYVLSDDPLLILADRQQVETALLNLVTNARDAMPEGGSVLVRCERLDPDQTFLQCHPSFDEGACVRVSVADTGIGMSAEIKGRMFDPFFTTKEKGTGLGLSMVYSLMRQSGGQVIAESEPGHGTTVSLYFPIVTAPAERIVSDNHLAPTGRGQTVLVVEDQDEVQETAMAMIEALGYAPLGAETAEAALVILGLRKVDMLFTDVLLPGRLSGLDLAREVRRRWPDIAVIATSGYSHVDMPDSSEGIGWLPKPYRRNDLADMIRSFLH